MACGGITHLSYPSDLTESFKGKGSLTLVPCWFSGRTRKDNVDGNLSSNCRHDRAKVTKMEDHIQSEMWKLKLGLRPPKQYLALESPLESFIIDFAGDHKR
ncbi:hypothetical protein ETB97_004979 [Aspergillus alliaceus]|uniref:Uncharacterized protein n=1 Tax=Petromyces alliaceus TaxID=209559 RepID=A0A8H6E3H7_PETAA|nr:hypothetical protein ETB97_004979 [Aspergillus burnettii]